MRQSVHFRFKLRAPKSLLLLESCTYEELGIPDFGGKNGISRFSCHFLLYKVCLDVKKYIPRIIIQLPFYRGTEMYRLLS